ncbi:MAG: metallophosphoesterase [Sedimentisphaerales bacterium]|nr:metallophosphoesterase [Sedimentisphaerales bacterium]
MPDKTVELLRKGIVANNDDKFRRGNLICLPSNGSAVITGDIHGHRLNFERIVAFANLEKNPHRHVILQEIIHGGPEDEKGGCLSYRLLFDVVAYKLRFPHCVHIIMGNHDTAFINNSDVMKNGKEMNAAMRAAIDRQYFGASEKVKLAIKQFLFSQPLAVKCPNRIFVSHSLPADNLADKFDQRIFHRQLRINDIVKPGSAYLLTWGRAHSQRLLDKMAKMLDVDIFIVGHQRQEGGYGQAGKNLIILASEHDHGCIMPVDLAKTYSIEGLLKLIIPLAAIA